MDAVRLAVLGCGGMGASLARGTSELDVAAVTRTYDPDTERAEALAKEFSAQASDDLEAVLAAEDVDGVLVAGPNDTHRELTVQAAQAGKHVFCEKPLALTVEDCRQMIRACEEAGVKLMVGQVLRYLPVFETMTELLATGDFGRPFSVATCRLGAGWSEAVERAPWRARQDLCGGVLFEVSQHELDYMRCVLGEVETVFCMADQYLERAADYPDLLYVLMRFEDEGLGLLQAGHAAVMGSYDGKILCEKGTIFFDNGRGLVTYQLAGQEPQTIETREREFEPGVRKEVREFCEAIVRDEEPTIPGLEGLRNVAIAEAAVQSAAERRPVEVVRE
ncbi:MAG: Gfo/Idh/MocA family protein [Armatimonadota bacterium]